MKVVSVAGAVMVLFIAAIPSHAQLIVRRGELHPPAPEYQAGFHPQTIPASNGSFANMVRFEEALPPPGVGGCNSPLRRSCIEADHAQAGRTTKSASSSYRLTGSVKGFRLSGVEPDGDPLYQIVLQTRLTPVGGQPVTLIVSSYMENFQPDTTPVLPDLLHPNKTATNLGGFLDGKTLLTDDAGNVLSIGVFLTEAFLDNSNHAVITLVGSGASKGTSAHLKGTFTLRKNATLSGRLQGQLTLSPSARKQIAREHGAHMKNLKSIISQVTVKPHYYGTAGNGSSSSAPLQTGFGQTGNTKNAPHLSGGSQSPPPVSTGTQTTRHLSPLTIIAGIGAVISLLLAGILFWVDKRRARATPPSGLRSQ